MIFFRYGFIILIKRRFFSYCLGGRFSSQSELLFFAGVCFFYLFRPNVNKGRIFQSRVANLLIFSSKSWKRSQSERHCLNKSWHRNLIYPILEVRTCLNPLHLHAFLTLPFLSSLKFSLINQKFQVEELKIFEIFDLI